MQDFDLINHKMNKYMLKLDKAYRIGEDDKITLYLEKYKSYVKMLGGAKTLEQIRDEYNLLATLKSTIDDINPVETDRTFEQISTLNYAEILRVLNAGLGKLSKGTNPTFQIQGLLKDLEEYNPSKIGTAAGAAGALTPKLSLVGSPPKPEKIFTYVDNVRPRKDKYPGVWYQSGFQLIYFVRGIVNDVLRINLANDNTEFISIEKNTYINRTLKIGECFEMEDDKSPNKSIYELLGFFKYNRKNGTVTCRVKETQRSSGYGKDKVELEIEDYDITRLIKSNFKPCGKENKLTNRINVYNKWDQINSDTYVYKQLGKFMPGAASLITLIVKAPTKSTSTPNSKTNEHSITIKEGQLQLNTIIREGECFRSNIDSTRKKLIRFEVDKSSPIIRITCIYTDLRTNAESRADVLKIFRDFKKINCKDLRAWQPFGPLKERKYQWTDGTTTIVVYNKDKFTVTRAGKQDLYQPNMCYKKGDELYVFDGKIIYNKQTKEFQIRERKFSDAGYTGIRFLADYNNINDIFGDINTLKSPICQTTKKYINKCYNGQPDMKILRAVYPNIPLNNMYYVESNGREIKMNIEKRYIQDCETSGTPPGTVSAV